ncbi:MAG: hypothetical protein Cons2KO_15660 [Congregibacter sp.]
MNPQTPIVLATAADEEALLPLIRDFYALEDYPFDEARLRRTLRPLLLSDQHGVVWKIGSPVSGYAVITWGYSLESAGMEALVDEIYVVQRNQGLGRVLMEHIAEDCRRRGIQRIFLETELQKERVRAFYRREGFAEDDSIWLSRWLTPSGKAPE